MAKVIWKYVLSGVMDTFGMPEGSKILTVSDQSGVICLWAEVDMSKLIVPRTFYVYDTGSQLPDNPGTYIGTVHMETLRSVHHVYETTV